MHRIRSARLRRLGPSDFTRRLAPTPQDVAAGHRRARRSIASSWSGTPSAAPSPRPSPSRLADERVTSLILLAPAGFGRIALTEALSDAAASRSLAEASVPARAASRRQIACVPAARSRPRARQRSRWSRPAAPRAAAGYDGARHGRLGDRATGSCGPRHGRDVAGRLPAGRRPPLGRHGPPPSAASAASRCSSSLREPAGRRDGSRSAAGARADLLAVPDGVALTPRFA